MNIYCETCKKEMEIMQDLGTVLHVHGCCDQAAAELAAKDAELQDRISEVGRLNVENRRAQNELAALQEQLSEEQQRNKLFGDCLHRGLVMWQKENPDSAVWISGDQNIAWLLNKVSALQERVRVLEEQNNDLVADIKEKNYPCGEALNKICKLIGAPEWEYPLQVVRDVEAALKAGQDE